MSLQTPFLKRNRVFYSLYIMNMGRGLKRRKNGDENKER